MEAALNLRKWSCLQDLTYPPWLTPKSRRSTFEYISKPEVVAMDLRRCGRIEGNAGRDEKQWRVEWTALSGYGWRYPSLEANVWQAPAGRTSKLTTYADLNIGSTGGPGSLIGCLVSGGAHWSGLWRSWARVMICWKRKQRQQPSMCSQQQQQ